jgi:hypothetical protein
VTLIGDCWIWPLGKSEGYGSLYLGGGRKSGQWAPAHRVVYELFRGPIPDGYDLHHLCGNRSCVSPFHLSAIDHAIHGGHSNGLKEFCKQGHPFDRENTYLDKVGHRHCRVCRRASIRRWRKREQEEAA